MYSRRRTALAGVMAQIVSLLALMVAAGTNCLRAETGVLSQLKNRFNQDKGVLRLVVLVSPTCPACVSGAEWIENYILKRYPTLDLKVYAVWYEMYPGDSPKAYPAAQKLMPDQRVAHWWDDTKEVGRWYFGQVPTNTKGSIEWDAFYLYGKDAVWGEQLPSPLLTWGRTILDDRKKLSGKIAELAGPPTAPAMPGASTNGGR